MDISLISKNQKTSLENALKEIYYIAVVEEEHDDDSILLQDIIALVEETLECQKKNFENLSGISPFLGSKYDGKSIPDKISGNYNESREFCVFNKCQIWLFQ